MNHPPDSPLFYTLTATNCYDCSTSVIGIFDSMRAIGYRLQRIHTTCGDEYHIDCFHLSTAVKENEELVEVLSSRAKYQMDNELKERLYKEHQEKESNDDEQLAEEIREERLNVA